MTDLIVRAFTALCVRLFPASGAHRTAPPAMPRPTPTPRRRPLPAHRSPYAEEALRPLVDIVNLVRPYLDAAPPGRPASPEQRAQAERRWAADMATRGIDVGPSVIHGVRVPHGSHTVRAQVAV